MTKFNGTLQNGTATAIIPRRTFNDGTYQIKTHYFENDNYKNSYGVGTLTINPFSYKSLTDYSWKQWTAITKPALVDPSINKNANVKIIEEDRWETTKSANMTDGTFTLSYPFVASGSGTSAIVLTNGSLRIRAQWMTDWMNYESDEDWDISFEVKINTLHSSSAGIYSVTGSNGGLWNIHKKWFDYDDSTSTGNVRTSLSNLTYSDGSTIQVTIEKRRTTITWNFTDNNGNSQQIVCENFEQTGDTRFAIRCSSDSANIVIKEYSRNTHIIRESSVVTDVVMMGRHNCVVLEQTIPVPVDTDNFVLTVTLKTTSSYDAIFLGRYEVATGNYEGMYNISHSNAFIIRPINLTSVPTDFAVWNFVFQNGICNLFINNVDTGFSYDFTNYNDDFRLGFIPYTLNSVQLSNITWSVNT